VKPARHNKGLERDRKAKQMQIDPVARAHIQNERGAAGLMRMASRALHAAFVHA
jgi:hypothetical protein